MACFITSENGRRNIGLTLWGEGRGAPLFDMTRKIFMKVGYFVSGNWRKKFDLVSDTVSIYVKFCKK